MKTIVVPVDLSSNSAKALKVAHKTAQKSGANLVVFHHYSYSSAIISNTEPVVFDTLLNDLEKQIEKDLSDFVKKTLGKIDKNVQLEATQGFGITDTLMAVVKKKKADLIIMGTQGASGLKRMVIGSYATQAIKNSTVPILVIPKNFKDSDFTKIAYASDLANIDKEVDKIVPFAQTFKSAIEIVHIEPLYPMPEAAKKFKPETKLEQLSKKYPGIKFSYKVVTTKIANDFHGGINKYIRKEKPDALVIVRHKRTWLDNILNPSRTLDLAYQASKPLYCISG
jgi:nucleotide-binding universal stress UspA family protein